MFNGNIRWSDRTQDDIERRKSIEARYHQAMESIKEGKYTLFGVPVNLNNPREVIAFLYVYLKELESFHEPF